ncbi:MAG: MutS2/Smr-associated SH3 domain-containing protein [Clostridia bacterium]
MKTLGQNGIIVSHISKSNQIIVKVGIIKTNVHINNIEKPHVDKTKKSAKTKSKLLAIPEL